MKLYEKRLEEKIEINQISKQDSINTSWKKIQKNIKDGASGALGTRTSHGDRKAAKTPWFCQEIKNKCKEILIIEHKEHQNYMKYIEELERTPQHV